MTLVEKYAFDSGRSCVKYFKDGSKILTGGVVGDIFVFGGIEETIDDEDFEPFNIGTTLNMIEVSQIWKRVLVFEKSNFHNLLKAQNKP